MSRPRRTVSAKGVLVDFDLMDIKSQISASPRPLEVKAREDFIDSKLRRRIRKSSTVATEMVRKDPTEAVSTPLPTSEEPEGMMHEVKAPVKPTVKQKAKATKE